MLSEETLRLSILQEAIQGRLVPQLEEEPAVEMEGIAPEEAPFAIPEKWKWVRLGRVIELLSGRDLVSNQILTVESGIPYITGASQIEQGNLIINRWTKNPCVISKKNDVLVVCKGTVGKLAINNYGDVHIARQIMSLRPLKKLILTRFLVIIMQLKSIEIAKNAKGIIPGFSRRDVLNCVIPLPPLSEQQRIVERLNELMPLVEQYGQSQTALMNIEQTLPEKLRASILQEAIKGKLVPQLEEEAAVEIDGTPSEEAPFAIPANWKWVKLEKVGDWKSGNTPSRSRKDYYEGGNIPWLKTGDLNDGLIYSVLESITSLAHKEVGLRINPADSVLMAMYGATIGKLGILASPCTTNQACCACIINKNITTSWWLFYYLLSQRKNFINLGAGGAQPNISKQKIINYLIPLPPLAEQKRIVERVQELLKLVDDLAGSCASQTRKS